MLRIETCDERCDDLRNLAFEPLTEAVFATVKDGVTLDDPAKIARFLTAQHDRTVGSGLVERLRDLVIASTIRSCRSSGSVASNAEMSSC